MRNHFLKNYTMAKQLMMAYVVALGLFTACEALQCHVCSSSYANGVSTGDFCINATVALSKNCEAGVLYCKTTTVKVLTTDAVNVTRGCGGGCTSSGIMETTINDVYRYNNCCQRGLCNNRTVVISEVNVVTTPITNGAGVSFLLPGSALSLLVASRCVHALW